MKIGFLQVAFELLYIIYHVHNLRENNVKDMFDA